MYNKGIVFLCLVLAYQANALPFLNLLTRQDTGYGGYSGYYSYPSYSSRMARQYGTVANAPTTYEQTSIDPNTGRPVVTHYVTHTRPGSPITALVQNVLNTIGRLVGDVGGAVGNAVGGTLAGAGQLGQDIQDFTKPITINQIVRPHPGPDPVRPLPESLPAPANPPTLPTRVIDPDSRA